MPNPWRGIGSLSQEGLVIYFFLKMETIKYLNWLSGTVGPRTAVARQPRARPVFFPYLFNDDL